MVQAVNSGNSSCVRILADFLSLSVGFRKDFQKMDEIPLDSETWLYSGILMVGTRYKSVHFLEILIKSYTVPKSQRISSILWNPSWNSIDFWQEVEYDPTIGTISWPYHLFRRTADDVWLYRILFSEFCCQIEVPTMSANCYLFVCAHSCIQINIHESITLYFNLPLHQYLSSNESILLQLCFYKHF